MNAINLVESFSEFKEFKNIDRPTMMKVLEDVFRTLLRKRYEEDENFDIIINTETGDLEIWRTRVIVKDGKVEDENKEISLSDAIKIEEDFQVGEDAIEEINRIMRELNSLSSQVSSAVEEQSVTTNEIARSMGEASGGVNEIVRNITGVAESAQDNSKQSLESKGEAESLGGLADRLSTVIETFEI